MSNVRFGKNSIFNFVTFNFVFCAMIHPIFSSTCVFTHCHNFFLSTAFVWWRNPIAQFDPHAVIGSIEYIDYKTPESPPNSTVAHSHFHFSTFFHSLCLELHNIFNDNDDGYGDDDDDGNNNTKQIWINIHGNRKKMRKFTTEKKLYKFVAMMAEYVSHIVVAWSQKLSYTWFV